jgi:hypothetical protein
MHHKMLISPIALLLCAGVMAHGQTLPGGESVGFTSGEKPALSYAGEQMPSNVLLIGVGDDMVYDSNVFSTTGAARQGDLIFNLGTHFSLLHQGKRSTISIDYLPYFQLYSKTTQYNRLDQTLSADMGLRLSNRWYLRARDTFSDQMNTYQPQLGGTVVSELGSPSTLNGFVYAPATPEQNNSTRIDFIYQRNVRTYFVVFGGYEQRRFKGEQATAQQMLNTQGETAGGQYTLRLTDHVTLGTLYLYQQLNLFGPLPEGSASRLPVHSGLVALDWQMSPTVIVDAFLGPQYLMPEGVQSATSELAPSYSHQLNWAGGGTITKQGQSTAVYLSAEHLITDGGGFLSYATNSSVDIGLRHRLIGNWDATWDVSFARTKGLSFGSSQNNIGSEGVNFRLERPVRGNLSVHLGYSFIHQGSQTTLPAGADFNRNQVSLGFYYELKKIPLTH